MEEVVSYFFTLDAGRQSEHPDRLFVRSSPFLASTPGSAVRVLPVGRPRPLLFLLFFGTIALFSASLAYGVAPPLFLLEFFFFPLLLINSLGLLDHGDDFFESGCGDGFEANPIEFAVDVAALLNEVEGVFVVLEADPQRQRIVSLVQLGDLSYFPELIFEDILYLLHDKVFVLFGTHPNVVVPDVVLDIRLGIDVVDRQFGFVLLDLVVLGLVPAGH